MLSTFGATEEQASHILELYRCSTLGAAADEAGINTIQHRPAD